MRFSDPHDQLLYVLTNIRQYLALLEAAHAKACPAARDLIDNSTLQHLDVDGLSCLISAVADTRETA